MSSVTDTDNGFTKAIEQFRGMHRHALTIGSNSRKVNKYLMAHESRFGFLRNTFDGSALPNGVGVTVQERIIAGSDAKLSAEDDAEKLAREIRSQILELGLVDTGALLASIEVKVIKARVRKSGSRRRRRKRR